MLERLRNVGPGALVTAAFIGPGTVTACTLAGAQFGYALLWALVFATVATIVLQEMSARLGVVTQGGLGDALATLLGQTAWKWPMIILVGAALYLGNAAYEAGNLVGTSLGLEALISANEVAFDVSIIVIASVAAGLIWFGSYKQVERVLLVLVVAMALSFVATFVIVQPDMNAMAAGLFVPSVPDGSILMVVALIGTTVVPYNLFLHASAVRNRFKSVDDLPAARSDTIVSISLGGIIAILIVSTSAASLFAAQIEVSSAADMAGQFEPLFGNWSKVLLGIGLFAAGLTSSITAPLATGYAMSEILQVSLERKARVLRAVALSVIAIGALIALTGINPVQIILTAQFANGLLLPVIAAFLFYAMNKAEILGRYTNGLLENLLGGIVMLVATGLGMRLVLRSIGLM